jgi:hypothetical protein
MRCIVDRTGRQKTEAGNCHADLDRASELRKVAIAILPRPEDGCFSPLVETVSILCTAGSRSSRPRSGLPCYSSIRIAKGLRCAPRQLSAVVRWGRVAAERCQGVGVVVVKILREVMDWEGVRSSKASSGKPADYDLPWLLWCEHAETVQLGGMEPRRSSLQLPGGVCGWHFFHPMGLAECVIKPL